MSAFDGASKSNVCLTDSCPCWKRRYMVPTRRFGSLTSPELYRRHRTRQSKVCDSRRGFSWKFSQHTNLNSSSLAFPLFGIGATSFQFPRSPVLCFFSLYSFLPRVFSYNITPPQFWSSYLSCPPASIFHVLITTSFSPPCPNYLTLASLIFSLMFATPAYKHKHY